MHAMPRPAPRVAPATSATLPSSGRFAMPAPPALAARTNRTRLFISEHSFINQVKMPRPRRISDEDVLAGAMRVMSRKGPDEFTLAAVAAEVGIAPPTIVQRFGDKRGLILRALAQDNGEFAAAVAAAPRERGRAAVIGLFLLLTPDLQDPDLLGNGLL